MSYVVPNPDAFMGMSVPDGQCVAYVKVAAGCPATSNWTNGQVVKGADISKGTAIATFQDGIYGNYTDGRSHAAIYISQDSKGITVHDQWSGQVVHERVIRFQGGSGQPRNDGDAFAVIENRVVLQAINQATLMVTTGRKNTSKSKARLV